MKEENKKPLQNLTHEGGQSKKLKKKVLDPKQRQEQEELLFQADAISPVNKVINRPEIVQLSNGTLLNVDDYIAETYAGKSTHFYLESFYFPIADLAGIPRDAMKNFIKPLIVPMLKRFLLYGRFPNAVQAKLYKKNKYTGYYSRSYWNYQWLTKEADLKLKEFISQFELEAERVLAAGGNLEAFITDYCTKYKLPIQLDMFKQR